MANGINGPNDATSADTKVFVSAGRLLSSLLSRIDYVAEREYNLKLFEYKLNRSYKIVVERRTDQTAVLVAQIRQLTLLLATSGLWSHAVVNNRRSPYYMVIANTDRQSS